MFKHNDRSTGFDNMEETISYHALQGWYNNAAAKVFNLLFASDEWRNTCRVYLSCLQQSQDERLFRPVSPRVHRVRHTDVCGVCRSIKLTSLRDASEDLRIPNIR